MHTWLEGKFDQREVIEPNIMAANQAAAAELDLTKMMESWFTTTAQSMRAGLDQAGRWTEV